MDIPGNRAGASVKQGSIGIIAGSILPIAGNIDVAGIDEDQQVIPEEKDNYEPLCRSCYNKTRKKH